MIRKLIVACLLSCGSALWAQSVPAAEGGRSSVWVGGELSTFNPDYSCVSTNSPLGCWDRQLVGVTAFADLNRVIGRVGLEGEARWLRWHGDRIKESNYLIGPRYQFYAGSRFSANLKFLAGGAVFDPPTGPWQGWAAFVPGITAGYRMTDRLIVRGDYEYQLWPGFVGVKGPHGLTPNGFSFGVSYRILR